MSARELKLVAPKRPWWRRFYQFSLKSLLILTFLLSLPLTAYVWRRERARWQAEGVALVQSVGGLVIYEQLDDGPIERPLADWQVRWFGKDFFLNVVDVWQGTGKVPYTGPGPTEADIKVDPAEADTFWRGVSHFNHLEELSVYRKWGAYGHPKALLGKFAELRVLAIEETGLADEDLEGLNHLVELDRAFLGGNHVGDETARRLSHCPNLKRLDLSDTRVTDEGLKLLSACGQLEWLSLERTEITDDGISHLSQLSRLEVLKLRSTKITDDGLAHLARLNKLRYLVLDDTAITDDGLRHLAALTALEDLDVRSTKVTGLGLIHLSKLPLLEELDLSYCPIDAQGLFSVSNLHHLRKLRLNDTTIPAAAFAKMKWPEKLERLDLDKTEFDDDALIPLLGHPAIKYVGLLWTRVSRKGHDEFQSQRPGILAWTDW